VVTEISAYLGRAVGIRYYHRVVPVKKLSVALAESVAQGAASAAERHGVSLSAWLNAAAERALVIEDGLAAVQAWEADHGELTEQELAWADAVLDSDADRVAF
jgi:hypothetical protein